MLSKSMRRPVFLVVVFLLAFIVRVGAVVVLRDFREGPSTRHGADGVEYSALAEHMVQGQGYALKPGEPTAFRPPGFPFFLAAIYAVLGRNYVVVHLALCMIGATGCLLTYLLASELLSERGARIAALLSVVYVPDVYLSTLFYSESLAIFGLAAGIWLFVRHLRTGGLGTLAGSGLILGFTTLIRPFALLLLPIQLAVLIWHQVRLGRFRPVTAAVFMASFLMVILPWTGRNYQVFGRFVLISTNGGSTFYGGNNDRVLNERDILGAWISTTGLPGRALIDSAADEVICEKLQWRLGWEWVRNHLAEIPRLSAYKLIRFWLPNIESPNKIYTIVQMLGYSPYLVLFMIGFVLCLRDRSYWTPSWMVLHATVFATVLTALIFWGSPRFRDSIASLLMVYASLGLSVFDPRIREKTPTSAKSEKTLCVDIAEVLTYRL